MGIYKKEGYDELFNFVKKYMGIYTENDFFNYYLQYENGEEDLFNNYLKYDGYYNSITEIKSYDNNENLIHLYERKCEKIILLDNWEFEINILISDIKINEEFLLKILSSLISIN